MHRHARGTRRPRRTVSATVIAQTSSSHVAEVTAAPAPFGAGGARSARACRQVAAARAAIRPAGCCSTTTPVALHARAQAEPRQLAQRVARAHAAQIRQGTRRSRSPRSRRRDPAGGRRRSGQRTGRRARATTTGGAGLIVGATPSWPQRRLGDALEDRRRDRAAGIAADARRVDHTMTVSAGLRDGTKPTNDTFCCDRE